MARLMNVEATIGIEKEYACVTSIADEQYYVLAGATFLDALQTLIADMGWRVIPEYSHALLEVVSAPVAASQIQNLINDLQTIDIILASAEFAIDNGARVWLSDKHSTLLKHFMRPDGTVTTDLCEILIDIEDRLELERLIATLPPPAFMDCNVHDAALRFAGFTALNLTVSHLSWTVAAVLQNERNRRTFGRWMFNRAAQLQKQFGRSLSASGSEGTLHQNFANWITGDFEKVIAQCSADIIGNIYGTSEYSDWTFKEKTNYVVRPRIIGANVCAEFRCLGSDTNIRIIRDIMLSLTQDAQHLFRDMSSC
jgi:hypothetical protein